MKTGSTSFLLGVLFAASGCANDSGERPGTSGAGAMTSAGAAGSGGFAVGGGGAGAMTSAGAAGSGGFAESGGSGGSGGTSSPGGSSGSAGVGGAGGNAGSAGNVAAFDAPDNAVELRPFLEAKAYAAWNAEPDYHLSTGPHGDGVRVFYGPTAAAALNAAATTFPKGAGVVKELTSQGYLYGWAVWVKVEDDSAAGNGFYWYEVIKGETMDTIYGDARGSSDCVYCHVPGKDFLLSSGEFE
ncbi:MAG TPA: hypothetical protein VM686_15625 [Polyangiaceae bacterium]|nr:hypothetical protein [Polyangiaceae bacterium]